jgi:acetylornithine deacetylase/succinyl-diaminopimelate desuccinylase-like protein
MIRKLALLLLLSAFPASSQTPDWPAVEAETLKHFSAVVQMDTQDPPGNETKVVEYVKKVLEAEGIPVIVSAREPARANLIARLKGNGSKRPLLIMGHTDTVKVDPAKWKFGPFNAARSTTKTT